MDVCLPAYQILLCMYVCTYVRRTFILCTYSEMVCVDTQGYCSGLVDADIASIVAVLV